VVGDGPRTLKLSVMADVDRTDYKTDILPKDKSVIDCVRVACYINQIPGALDMIRDAHDKGYETALNIMAISSVQDRELEDALAAAAKSPVDTVYVVDSNGSLYSEQVHDIVMGFLGASGRHGQAGRHPRPQQHAAGLRQHHRGAHRRRQSPGRYHRGPRPRRRQLSA
jgi:4-hydroxy 2-oxovalerate aldolase